MAQPSDSATWNVWLSAGVGAGPVAITDGRNPGNGTLAGALRLSASYNQWFGEVRTGALAPFFSGDGINERALLAGARTRGQFAFLTGAVGAAVVEHYYADESGNTVADPAALALAWDAGAHLAYWFIGVGVNVGGVEGARANRAMYATLSLELGAFGR